MYDHPLNIVSIQNRIRVPLIPAINDDIASLTAIAAFVSEKVRGAWGVEVLPYHPLGKGKYRPIGLEYPLAHLDPPNGAFIDMARGVFRDLGVEILQFN